MADAKADISEKIAKQIAQIVKESVEIDIKMMQYFKEDIEEIQKIAKEQNLPAKDLIVQILDGIKKGLVESGKVTMEEIGKILEQSETSLRDTLHLPPKKKREKKA